MKALAIGLLVALSGVTMAAEGQQEPPTVRAVWREQLISGGVERPSGQTQVTATGPMPPGTYEVKDGIYRSMISRIALRIPRIADEKVVDVREAIALYRQDGSPATTHVMFDPGGTRSARELTDPQSAVIVTRLRDDRPKDGESVLAGIEGGETERARRVATGGFSYVRIETKLGPAWQRVVRNRAHTVRFPYETAILREAEAKTYGVSTFVVVGTDSFVEFSQLFPCASLGEVECRAAAQAAHDSFVGGVTSFLMHRPPDANPPPGTR